MPKKKPLVVVTRKLPDTVETRMRELFETRLNLDDRAMTQAELVDAVRTAGESVIDDLKQVGDRKDAHYLILITPGDDEDTVNTVAQEQMRDLTYGNILFHPDRVLAHYVFERYSMHRLSFFRLYR